MYSAAIYIEPLYIYIPVVVEALLVLDPRTEPQAVNALEVAPELNGLVLVVPKGTAPARSRALFQRHVIAPEKILTSQCPSLFSYMQSRRQLFRINALYISKINVIESHYTGLLRICGESVSSGRQPTT